MAAIARMGSLGKGGKTVANEASVREELQKLIPTMAPPNGDIADCTLQERRPSIGGASTDAPSSRQSSLSACSDARRSSAPKAISSTPSVPSLKSLNAPGFGGAKSVSMHSILARAKANVDLKELPSTFDLPPLADAGGYLPQKELPSSADLPGSYIKQMDFQNLAKKSNRLQLNMASDPQSAVAAKVTMVKNQKDRTMNVKEENLLLNSELEGLGRPQRKTTWASPEIENMWLRREATSQLLQKLCVTSKNMNTSLLDLDDDSTRAPSSAGGSVRRYCSSIA